MTYEEKSAIVIEQLRADRDRLLGVLEKIRAEIEEYKSRQQLTLAIGVKDLEKGKQIALEYVLAILDKYKAASEKGMSDNFEAQGDVFDKIRAEILDEAEYAYADFDRYKEDILYAEPDELPDDDFRYGMERAVEIIDKYRKDGSE